MKDKIEKIEKEIRQLSGEIRVRSFFYTRTIDRKHNLHNKRQFQKGD